MDVILTILGSAIVLALWVNPSKWFTSAYDYSNDEENPFWNYFVAVLSWAGLLFFVWLAFIIIKALWRVA